MVHGAWCMVHGAVRGAVRGAVHSAWQGAGCSARCGARCKAFAKMHGVDTGFKNDVDGKGEYQDISFVNNIWKSRRN